MSEPRGAAGPGTRALSSRLLRPLALLRLADAPVYGRKAALLGELVAAGFPVPDGYALAADALDEAVAGPGPAEREGPAWLVGEIHRVTAVLGNGPLAVRSSGVAEDLSDRSYAGQYESVLHVYGPQAALKAIRVCRKSADSARVRAYGAEGKTAPGGETRARMAIIIQRMVVPELAGVAFSANPVTGDRGEAVVSAASGLGDRLAAGGAADDWVVRDGTAIRLSRGGDASPRDAIVAVAALVRQVAAHFGAPQDVEWALVAGQLVLLQARPVTALPDPPPVTVEVPAGHWLRGGYSLRPLSPMNVSTMVPAVSQASARLFEYSLGDRIEVRSIGGWSYVRFGAIEDAGQARERLRAVLAALRADEPFLAVVRRWADEWGPELAGALDQAAGVDLAALDDQALVAHIGALHDLAKHAQRLHFAVGGASAIVWAGLGVVCAELLGWTDDAAVGKVVPLLTGLPGKTVEPTEALAELAVMAASRPAVRAVLDALPSESGGPAALGGQPGGLLGDELDTLARADPGFAAAVRDYLRRYGGRCVAPDLAEPTMAERPLMVLRLIRDHDTAPPHEDAARRRAAAVDAARAALSGQPLVGRARFDEALARAEAAYPLREDTAFFAHVAWGTVRLALLELGGRMAARGTFEAPDDVFLLRLTEACQALVGGQPAPGALAGLLAQRAAELAWSRAHMGPPSYGEPARPEFSLELLAAELPAEDQRTLAPVLWADAAYRGAVRRPSARPGGLLHGVAASPGQFTGPARIVVSEADFGRLLPGDVLVCPETTPQWSVLFGTVGALVTDSGGMLSHPALIAREYGIPAVVATADATRLLREGQLVAVDGTAGTVTVG
jgi:phosphohistidine swiveling domain-containing protein